MFDRECEARAQRTLAELRRDAEWMLPRLSADEREDAALIALERLEEENRQPEDEEDARTKHRRSVLRDCGRERRRQRLSSKGGECSWRAKNLRRIAEAWIAGSCGRRGWRRWRSCRER